MSGMAKYYVKSETPCKGELTMKVLIINGSPHPHGNTAIAVNELVKTFTAEGIIAEVCQVGNKDIRGCIACGKCEKNCPVSAIKMQDGKPVWRGSTCAHCMACIQNCPVESINFRDRTQNRKRYRFDDFRYVLKESE